MPELPEVETIRQQLLKEIVGKKIKELTINDSQIINLPPEKFQALLTGVKIKDIRRRAKLLIFDFNNDYSLIVHLKLTGRFIYFKNNQKIKDKAHLIFIFQDKTKLLYQDIRKFGYLKLVPTNLAQDIIKAHNFGPEVLDKDFTLERFEKVIRQKPKAKIKPLLMDQSILAGIGNVYSQEACFRAGINPQRTVKSLSKEDVKRLYQALKKVVVLALKKRGSSVDTYLDIYGKRGDFEPLLKVYGRENKPCFNCGAKIKRIKMNGRSTYFCPKCQK